MTDERQMGVVQSGRVVSGICQAFVRKASPTDSLGVVPQDTTAADPDYAMILAENLTQKYSRFHFVNSYAINTENVPGIP